MLPKPPHVAKRWIVFLWRKVTSDQAFGSGHTFTQVTSNIAEWEIILDLVSIGQVLEMPSKMIENKC